jgi:beta propeller repeat protein
MIFLSGNLVNVTHDAGGYYPSVSDDRLVWENNGDIYLYTISTGTTGQLTSDTAFQWRPLISGDTVVWVEDNYEDNYLVLYDLSTGEKRQLMDMTVNWMYPSAISGNLLVCEMNGNIYLYDCTSGMAQQLTDDDLYQYSPAISGNTVVWTTDTTTYSGEIYLYDTNTATEKRLTDNDQLWSLPVVSGDRVIWTDEDGTVIQDLVTGIKAWILTDQDGLNWESYDGDFVAGTGYRQGQCDLFYCNVSSGNLVQVTNDTQQEYDIGVSGTYIVWISNGDVYLHSISDGTTEQLTDDSASQWSRFSAISGDRVVWQNDGSDIYLYTISTGVTSRLTSDGELRDSLDISGDRVIWHEDSDVVALDLVSGTQTRISSGSSARCYEGVISGDMVAYLVDYGWHNDLALYDLSSGSETRITTDVFDQWSPDIDGNHLVWEDNRGYNTDIRLFSAPQEDSTTNTICFEPGSSSVTVGASKNITVIIDTVPDGLSGFNITVALTDPSIGEIVGVSYPPWASMPVNGSLPADAVYTQAVDLMSSVGAGATNVTLCTLTVRGGAAGATNLTITATKIDDDFGGRYAPKITDAILIVESLPAPTANFTANVTAGAAPLDVQFTDLSSQDPSGWAWYFGNEDFKDSWTQVTASAGWAGRYDQSSVALPDGSIVLMGGINAEGVTHYFNDVWRSTDYGETWTQVNASAGWSSRCRANCVTLPDGSIVLMGGSQGGYTRYNDVWRSTDNGVTWTQMNASAGWSKRYGHSSVAMPDGSIVVMGGYDGDAKNDVWRSTDTGTSWTLVTANAACLREPGRVAL